MAFGAIVATYCDHYLKDNLLCAEIWRSLSLKAERDSSVNIMASLQAGRLKNHDLVCDTGDRFISPPELSNWLCDPSRLLSIEYEGLFHQK
jgi:hypothetical protein